MELQELGPYDLKEVLGKGGMGTVYRGVNRDSGEEVAVKVLAPFYAAHDGFRERFTAEIRSLEQLRHPFIVTLYGYGEDGGILFYAMELIRGNSLQDELANGRRFEWREVCQICADVCGALKQAHDHGIIHRDIKPANLLLDQLGRVKLSDFGIAKLFGDTNVTVGGVLGTVDYMAPEQAEGAHPTPRCDLYSLGAVMYALLTGRPPFRGKTVAEVLQKLRFEDPERLGTLNTDTPVELEKIVHRLLDKEPRNRIPTALALSKWLNDLLQQSNVLMFPTEIGDIDELSVGLPVSDQEDELSLKQTISPNDELDERALSDLETQDAVAEAMRRDASPVEPKQKVRKYVEVDEQPFEDRSESDESWQSFLLTWGILLASMAGIAIFVTNALKPPTADELFTQISAAVESDDELKLLDQRDNVNKFIIRFPKDDRTLLMKTLSGDLDEMMSVRRLESRLKRGTRSEKDRSPLEDKLLAAMKLEESNALAAAQQYRALIDLFSNEVERQSGIELQCLKLARERLNRIESQQQQNADNYRSRIEKRLAHARRLDAEDLAAADRIRAAIISLYEDEPWAQELVAQAKSELAVASNVDARDELEQPVLNPSEEEETGDQQSITADP
jgi:serine/threonine-protein kinase